MKTERKGVMRGYKKLRVWQDARELYLLTWPVFKAIPYELSRIRSQQLASVDSVHRNIAEGYCRRSIKEYIQFLNYALASLGESVSSLDVYVDAGHISEEDFEKMDALALKLENGLKKLVESMQNKQSDGSWSDSFMIKESNATYQTVADRDSEEAIIHESMNPEIQ
ncbi:four helix bundle protein [Pontiellaceae bacterium B1224]|nr:four helix bundle protein [Pontiellaceae bacterium B1224]